MREVLLQDITGSDLIMFSGTECTHCHEMDPLVQQMEQDLGVEVKKLEVWHNAENAKFLSEVDNDLCGGIPFFYNQKSKGWICGNAEMDRLKKWALGED